MKEERKHKEIPTSKLLDFTGKEIEFSDDKNYYKKQEYENEIEKRQPFNDIKAKLDRLQEQVNTLNKTVEQLKSHMHTNGKVVVDINDQRYRRW